MVVDADFSDQSDVMIDASVRTPGRDIPKAFRIIDRVLSAVMVALLVILVLSLGYNVFGRFVLGRSLAIADELARFLFIWLVFIGAALAHLHNEHIAVDFVTDRLPFRIRRYVAVFGEMAVLGFLVVVLAGSWRLLDRTTGFAALSKIPFFWFNLSMPLAVALMGVISVWRIVRIVKGDEW